MSLAHFEYALYGALIVVALVFAGLLSAPYWERRRQRRKHGGYIR